MYLNNYINYETALFTDVYGNVDSFLSDYQNAGLPATISTDNATILFYLLYARYGNSPIANKDVNQFKYKMFSVIWQYGPTWEKRLELQETLRGLALTDITDGGKSKQEGSVSQSGSNTTTTTLGSSHTSVDSTKTINNHAYNPSTEPGTDTDTELSYINEQNVSKNSGGVTTTGSGSDSTKLELGTSDTTDMTNTLTTGLLDGYEHLTALLENDVTEEFLGKFKWCFKTIVRPEHPAIYEEDE